LRIDRNVGGLSRLLAVWTRLASLFYIPARAGFAHESVRMLLSSAEAAEGGNRHRFIFI
jgi:hypothetical protein